MVFRLSISVFAPKRRNDFIMETATLERPQTFRKNRRNLVACQAAADEQLQKNRVVIENGEVKTLLFSDTVELEEARALLHEMVRLEYSLP